MPRQKLFQARYFKHKGRLRLGILLLFLVVSATLKVYPGQLVTQESNYAIHTKQDFNQPSYYPIAKIGSGNLYQPIASWVGRLILPTKQEIQLGSDWVWLEIQHAPTVAQNLVGKVVRLEWKNQPELQSYVKTVMRDVNFTDATKESDRQGNIHPSRLDGRLRVGPLQSLAGARPNDDVIVTLADSSLPTLQNGQPVLQIDREPVLVTGRYYGLVKILSPKGEFFQVQHYNPDSNKFDGVGETIRIPQQVLDTRNIFPSTSQQLEVSPAGNKGWYIYGAKDAKGVFVVQSLAPRSLFQLQPDRTVLGEEAGLIYIKEQNWHNTEVSKGTSHSILLDQLPNWQQGDKAIALHLFGGIGGKKGEGSDIPNTITGHFAFGQAEVVRDPLTNQLQFAIEYHQVYAHNPDGIIAGTHSWADYMGNLHMGWLATRPVSDVLIKFDAVTQDYNFDTITLSPLQEFHKQLQVMMARYRVGDGTGSATVSPATSCVQDSSQALYTAIKVIKQRVSSTTAIQQWLKTHPNDPQTLRWKKLVSLGAALEEQLTPLGIVRADWESNATEVTGIDTPQPFRERSIWAGLTSWRSVMPRQAHDELAALFLKHGAKLWFLRTNQVGGSQADINPVAPTELLGQIRIPYTEIAPIPIVLNRILTSLALPKSQDWLVVGLTLLIFGAIALPLGFEIIRGHGENLSSVSYKNLSSTLSIALKTLITPALSEELVFRVLLLPHPMEVVSWMRWILWAGFILLLFLIYHLLKPKRFSKAGHPTSLTPISRTLTVLLGITCTVAYAFTGSLWAIASIHWIVVLTWLLLLGGIHKLQPN